MDKLRMQSFDKTGDNIKKIASLFPQCVTERMGKDGKPELAIDFEKLKNELSGEVIDEGEERYQFTWPNKKAAEHLANTPTTMTLRPCREESLDFDTTQNLYIEGDNLEVLKVLRETYLGKVKMIYIDPPYNTGNDFVYNDDFAQSAEEYKENSGQLDEEGNRMVLNAESNGRFHTDWLNMIYPRLKVAKDLLTNDGVIFISIDDNEVRNLRNICDEVFGEGNFVSNIIWQSTAGSNTGTDIVTITENILVYVKSRICFIFDGMLSDKSNYTLSDEFESERGKYCLDKMDRRRVGSHYSDALNYPITMPDGSIRFPGGFPEKSKEGWNYLWSKTKVEWGIKNGFIEFKQSNGEWAVYNKRYFNVDNDGNPIERTIPFRNLILSDSFNTAQGTSEIRNLFTDRPFDFPKPSGLIKWLLLMVVRTNKDAIILDFFSGSATTAHAVMQLNAKDGGNRKFIMVQLPEKTSEKSEAYKAGYKNICEIGKERIRRAAKKIAEENPNAKFDGGFRVFKVDDSNMKDVYYAPAEYSQSLLDKLESNIKEDRTDLDLFFGCILDWGLPLNLSYTSETIENCSVHTYSENALIACFNDNIPESVIKEIAKRKPLRVVFRDSSFADTPSKINVTEIFKLLSPDTRVKVI